MYLYFCYEKNSTVNTNTLHKLSTLNVDYNSLPRSRGDLKKKFGKKRVHYLVLYIWKGSLRKCYSKIEVAMSDTPIPNLKYHKFS